MTTLVLGANGQVGRHLSDLMPEAVLWQRKDVDLTDPRQVESEITALAPTVVVNASAYTAVDRAETDAHTAWLVNAESVAVIARVCAAIDASLVHFSTDYVFDGQAPSPYTARSPTRPLGVYGRTKLAGELAVQCLCERFWILRTSWVFSEFGSNFVKTMLRLAAERDTLRVVSDQRGRPSYAYDMARVAGALVAGIRQGTAPFPGIYHTGGGPPVSWCEFASEILSRAAIHGLIESLPEIQPIPTAEYPTPARRPMNAVLEPDHEFQRKLGIEPDWQAGLDRMLLELKRLNSSAS